MEALSSSELEATLAELKEII